MIKRSDGARLTYDQIVAERDALAAELVEWRRMRNEAMAVATSNRNVINQLEAALRDAVTYLNALQIPDVEEEDRCIEVIRQLNAVLTPPETNCDGNAGSIPAPVLTEQGDVTGSGTGVLTAPHRLSSKTNAERMTRPYRLEVDEEMHVCSACNQDAQYYVIIGPDGLGLGTSYAMAGKDDAEEMVDMLNDAFEAGEESAAEPK